MCFLCFPAFDSVGFILPSSDPSSKNHAITNEEGGDPTYTIVQYWISVLLAVYAAALVTASRTSFFSRILEAAVPIPVPPY